jgi:hypothetical protein
MMGSAYNLAFAPLLPWWSLGALAGVSLLVVALVETVPEEAFVRRPAP